MYIFGGYTDDGNTSNLYRVNLSPLNYSFNDKCPKKATPQVSPLKSHLCYVIDLVVVALRSPLTNCVPRTRT